MIKSVTNDVVREVHHVFQFLNGMIKRCSIFDIAFAEKPVSIPKRYD